MDRMFATVRIAAAVAVISMSVAACGDREASNVTADTPTAPPIDAPAATPPVPPQSMAAQHESGLISQGAELTDEGLKVTLSSADFASGSTEFKPASTERIEHVAGLLRERSDLRVVVAGYTDDRGSDASNKRLSKLRAEAVRDYLVKGGADASRIEAQGMGEADPVAGNDTEAGRVQNRRVELRITNESGKYEGLASR